MGGCLGDGRGGGGDLLYIVDYIDIVDIGQFAAACVIAMPCSALTKVLCILYLHILSVLRQYPVSRAYPRQARLG